MSDTPEEIKNFEHIFNNNAKKAPLALYNEFKTTNTQRNKPEKSCSAQDVILNVNQQIKAMQRADSVLPLKQGRRAMDKYKKSTFLSVNILASEAEVTNPKPANRFETQCVSDTQLMDIIEKAEAMADSNNGITQEFDKTFCEMDGEPENVHDDGENKNTHSVSKVNDESNLHINIEKQDNVISKAIATGVDEINEGIVKDNERNDNINVGSIISKLNSKVCINYNYTEDSNAQLKEIDTKNSNTAEKHVVNIDKYKYKENHHINSLIDDDVITPSPVFQVHKSKCPSPLVFDLDSFEKFENIALPIIEENPDLTSAKQLINSQIIGKEFVIGANVQCETNINTKQTSPILKIDTENLKISKTSELKLGFKTPVNKDESVLTENKESNDTFLRDEILFSSDEEEEYVHKELLDVPLTCALETSFYDQPDVLDKTMYVGFQTASNRSIQINTNSFTKAKSLLDEVEKEVATSTSISELVDNLISKYKHFNHNDRRTDLKTNAETSINNNSKSNNSEKSSNKIDLISNQGKLSIETEIETLKRPDKRKFEGFITASRKKIKLSDMALARCKKVFHDIDLEDEFNDSKDTHKDCHDNEHMEAMNTKHHETKSDAVYSHLDDDVLQEFSNDMSMIEEDKNETDNFLGFRISSKKEIKISEAPIANTKDDIEPGFFNEDFNKPSTIKRIMAMQSPKASLTKCNFINQDTNIDEKLQNMTVNQESKPFVGFKTANNKKIEISKQSLLKTRDFFKDIDKEVNKNDKLNPIERINTPDTYDSKVLNEELCKDLSTVFENEMDIESEPKGFCGFETASNKPIRISEKALLNTKKIFNGIEVDNDCDDEANIRSDSGVLKKSRTEGDYFPKDCDIKSIECKTSPNIQQLTNISFKTASSKPIKISKSAMERCKKIFEDLKGFNEISNNEEVIRVSDADVNKNKLLLRNLEQKCEIDNAYLKGFKTANNNPITVSSDALAKSKVLFKDIDSEYESVLQNRKEDENPCKDTPQFRGFQTANNKPIAVSAAALAKSKGLFEDINYEDKPKVDTEFKEPEKLPFKSFKNANNKLISVSDEALAKSKSIFNDLHREDDISKSNIGRASSDVDTKPMVGFQTASNKRISVSTEALARSKQLFKDIDNEGIEVKTDDESMFEKHMFKGFQTANNKPVTVSKEGLARSKALFKDIDEAINIKNISDVKSSIKFEGFKTANQKTITISHEALAKSKALFKDIDNDENTSNTNTEKFKGFQTASNKPVVISEEAVLKSKKMFEDIDGFKENVTCNQFKGFQTASNKKVNVSEQALKRTRQIFQDIDLSENCKDNSSIIRKDVRDFKENVTVEPKSARSDGIKRHTSEESNKILRDVQERIKEKNKALIKPAENILEKLIDTQMMNDFEETLHTEDFCKINTPRQSKRSGSPILSCPKAKRRKKFETPYRNDGKSFVDKLDTDIMKPESMITFNSDYKKTKRFKLKDLSKAEESSRKAIPDPYILNFNLSSFLDFEFTGKRNDITDEKVTVQDLKELFLKSVNKKLIPTGWVENHVVLIIWKLISYEIRFPNTLSQVCKTKNVLEQLKYRFDRELYNAERPALRKILEKDDVPSKTMVLCVAGVFVDGHSVKSVTNISANVELLLTDGWYCVKAIIDKMLIKFVYDEKITVGCKIVTTGAELVNCEQGVSPWEDTSSVRLKLSGNSTRPARWDARLGYHANGAMLTRLSSVKPEGGKVSKLRLFVARAYPMLYVEKFEDGSTVTRSERLEHIHQAKYETERQTTMEKLYEEVEKELSDQESQDSLSSQVGAQHRKGLSGSRITESQAKSFEDRSSRKREKLLQDMQDRVRRKIEERGLDRGRNVVTLLKVRVAGVDVKEEHVTVTKGLMSIWNPNDLLTDIIKEGAWIDVINVVPTAIRYSEIHLSAGRQSIFSHSQIQEDDITKPHTLSLKRTCYPIKDLAQNPTMSTDYNEIDTTGLIFQIDQQTNQPFQNIYLTDSEKNIICVNFWGGLKKFGFQNVLEVGHVIYGTNLQKRAGNTRKSIPQFRVTEFSYFTKTPKNVVVRNLIEDLQKKLAILDKKRFCEECVNLKNNFSSKCITDVSPYRFNNDHNLTKNRVFIESPLAAEREDNFNLTGLDFESTFKQTDEELSPKTLQRRRQLKQKIAKLKMIGEPPPLSPINIINKSKTAFNSYRSPLAQTSVTSVKKSYQNSRINEDIQSSPFIQCDVNKSYQRNVARVNQTRTSEDRRSSPLTRTENVIKSSEAIQPSPLVQPNVASMRKTYQNSRISNDDVPSSPVFSMNRTYVKNVNPVKLNFSNVQDNSIDDVVDQFAEEFDGSPPLSLD